LGDLGGAKSTWKGDWVNKEKKDRPLWGNGKIAKTLV